MSTTIFRHETSTYEEWLDVDDDRTATYHIENSGWPMMRGGVNPRETKMSVEQAKSRWPEFADRIEAALKACPHGST